MGIPITPITPTKQNSPNQKMDKKHRQTHSNFEFPKGKIGCLRFLCIGFYRVFFYQGSFPIQNIKSPGIRSESSCQATSLILRPRILAPSAVLWHVRLLGCPKYPPHGRNAAKSNPSQRHLAGLGWSKTKPK